MNLSLETVEMDHIHVFADKELDPDLLIKIEEIYILQILYHRLLMIIMAEFLMPNQENFSIEDRRRIFEIFP